MNGPRENQGRPAVLRQRSALRWLVLAFAIPVVIALLGIFAVVAIYGLRRYLASARPNGELVLSPIAETAAEK